MLLLSWHLRFSKRSLPKLKSTKSCLCTLLDSRESVQNLFKLIKVRIGCVRRQYFLNIYIKSLKSRKLTSGFEQSKIVNLMTVGHVEFAVPVHLVNAVRQKLKEQNLFERDAKITEYKRERSSSEFSSWRMIPSTLALSAMDDRSALLSKLGLSHHSEHIELVISNDDARHSTLCQTIGTRRSKNPLHTGVTKWIRGLSDGSQLSALGIDNVIDTLPRTFSVYPPLLLLPAHTFSDPLWQKVFRFASNDETERLYTEIAKATGRNCVFVALNAPIPLTISVASNEKPEIQEKGLQQNTLRSPSNLTPLYGDFGPPAPIPNPQQADFADALWVSTTQNGIRQTWAPVHTMFARGNVSEKARLLKLLSVTSLSSRSPERGGNGASEEGLEKWTAVDLYAGIGYFSFCYARAGAAVVMGWELNGWSVEGFRRGCEMNGWPAAMVEAERDSLMLEGEGSLVGARKGKEAGQTKKPLMIIHHESNVNALQLVSGFRQKSKIPPVRHVNCGLLPTSLPIWQDAVHIVDPEKGGWIHLHENCASDTESLTKRKAEVLEIIRGYYKEAIIGGDNVREKIAADVVVEDAFVVKSYAPGVVHVVFDAYIPPRGT